MKFNNKIPLVKGVGFSSNFHNINKLGLGKAYASDNSTHIDGEDMYIAGTKTARDVFSDWIKIPLGLTRYSTRYKEAEEVLKANPQVKNLIGHSLGSAVSDELSKRNEAKQLNTTLYGSPFVDFTGKQSDNRYRHKFDPVSILDRKAKTVDLGLVSPLEAHGYDQYD
jgi:hypothetical protein